MRSVRTFASAALLGGAAVAFAAPAFADVLTTGLYSVDRSGIYAPGNGPMMWNVTMCGPGCAKIIGDEGVIWNVHLANGQWSTTLHRPNAVDCRNGTQAPGASVFTLDAQTLPGTIVGTSDGPACGSPAPITGSTMVFFMDQA